MRKDMLTGYRNGNHPDRIQVKLYELAYYDYS